MKIIYATNVLPHGCKNGGEIASMNVIDAFEELGHEVYVVGYVRCDAATVSHPRVYSAGAWPIELSDASRLRRALWVLRALATGRPIIQTKFMSRAYVDALSRAGPETADLLVIDHAHMGWITSLRGLPARRVFLAHNVETALYRTFSAYVGRAMSALYRREARILAYVEKRLLLGCKQTWCLSETDRDALRKIAGNADVALQVIDMPSQGFADTETATKKTHDIGLIGTFNWAINRHGVDWFLSKVLPLLKGDIRIQIAGSGSQDLACDDPRVTRLGRVPDAGTFMRSNRVIVVPTTVGSGIQIKTIEGLSLGAPMVGTPLAFRGISALPDNVRIAEDAEHFALALRELLAEPMLSAREEANRGVRWAEHRRASFTGQIAKGLAALDT